MLPYARTCLECVSYITKPILYWKLWISATLSNCFYSRVKN